MGLFDLIRPRSSAVQNTRSALDEAKDGTLEGNKVTQMVQGLLALGLEGRGPIDSATDVAAHALADTEEPEAAIRQVIKQHVRSGAAGGFLTGLGGFVTMPIALPANVVEFYVQATRMVGSVATLRGYDVADPQIRSAILLTLIGADADDILKRAGLSTGGGRVAALATRPLGPAARLMINKGVGFQLLRSVGERSLSRLGRGIPLAGGMVGAGLDGYMMNKIAEAAKREFPAVKPVAKAAVKPAATLSVEPAAQPPAESTAPAAE